MHNRIIVEDKRAVAEIDLSAIRHNVLRIKDSLSKNTKLMAIVKADGYGHGSVQSAGAAIASGADWLGVATADEGVTLRENGFDIPILVVGYTPEDSIYDALRAGLTQTVFSLNVAAAISRIAAFFNLNAKIHIKVDTGMGRLGFADTPESVNELLQVRELPNIEITGIYTHLANSDSEDPAFAREQVTRFRAFICRLEDKSLHIPVKHVSNSAATVNYREFDFDMVRTGVIIYGISMSDNVNIQKLGLKPALEWKSYVCYVKTVGSGISIGYNRTYFTKRETVVATVPVGYADGYSRMMSNRGKVLINGMFAPIIGNICMDQFMVDVTDIPGVNIGAEVVLLGKSKDKEITAADLARFQDTVTYEVVCGISKRVYRIYRN